MYVFQVLPEGGSGGLYHTVHIVKLNYMFRVIRVLWYHDIWVALWTSELYNKKYTATFCDAFSKDHLQMQHISKYADFCFTN